MRKPKSRFLTLVAVKSKWTLSCLFCGGAKLQGKISTLHGFCAAILRPSRQTTKEASRRTHGISEAYKKHSIPLLSTTRYTLNSHKRREIEIMTFSARSECTNPPMKRGRGFSVGHFCFSCESIQISKPWRNGGSLWVCCRILTCAISIALKYDSVLAMSPSSFSAAPQIWPPKPQLSRSERRPPTNSRYEKQMKRTW